VAAAVPLVPPKVSVVQLPAEGSAAQIAQILLGDGVRVVSAFHNVGATKLHSGGRADCDVLVFGNDKESRDIVIGLANEVGNCGIDGGVLANSAAAEALTSVLIGINRRYKVPGAGIRHYRASHVHSAMNAYDGQECHLFCCARVTAHQSGR
jgi:8-hydroxy-5-deazaflavin:NADPH oxidoreductase